MIAVVTVGYQKIGKLQIGGRHSNLVAIGKLIAAEAQEELFVVVRGRWADPDCIAAICCAPIALPQDRLPVSLEHASEALTAQDLMQDRVTCIHVYHESDQPNAGSWEQSLARDYELAWHLNVMAARGENELNLELPVRYVVVRGEQVDLISVEVLKEGA